MAAQYSILRERDDGDFDHVMVIETDNEDGSTEKTEELISVVPAADKNFPYGRPSNEEVEDANRQERNNALTDSDWWACSDLTMTQEQISYRSALRDLPTHANWPNLEPEDWPTNPIGN
tara:strand:+ start:111 stop:467 length:357 start_codon:yes stop_codon:yes gene_type:complete